MAFRRFLSHTESALNFRPTSVPFRTMDSKHSPNVEKKLTRSGVKRKKFDSAPMEVKPQKSGDEEFTESKVVEPRKQKTARKILTGEKSSSTQRADTKIKEKKSTAKKQLSEADKPVINKPQLQVPQIKIPLKSEVTKRIKGPSPWGNGTIHYTNKMYIGAHVSAAGGLENAVFNAVKIGATSFALFLKSQRQWAAKPMEDSTVKKFKDACLKHNISSHLILPHGSYLMNLASPDEATLAKSRTVLLDEVQRCERLGLLYYNIHPGSTCGKTSREEGIKSIADSINWLHQETPQSKVAVVLENMCRQGHTIGGDLSDLAGIIRLVYDQSRVGVCIDTCHALAAGYDMITAQGFQTFLDNFDQIVGLEFLVGVHLNDSEGAKGCHRDRHASIGKGHIGRANGFRHIINCPQFRDLPVILETPYISDDTYQQEILLLKSMIEDSPST